MLDLATSRAGVTRLVTTNFDLLFALAISDYGYVLSKGRVVTEGKPSELAKTKEVHQAYFG
jgi:ABC-type branched-subunit amino acid transport system ATPase component